MGIIKILDESVSNAIAAGEVVENPTSMIKELIENSLDAESTSIKIDVRNGGLDLSIEDDGKGMIKEDLLLSIERHATSKIQTKEDLFKISTYGFRGEALSSISAVSKMILSSRTKEMENGVQINVLGGKVTNLKDVQKNIGTYIEIRDLFYNTPARLKFLRKESTEYLNIKDVVLKEALANSNVKFILTLNGKESIRTSGNGIENAIVEIFGKNYLKNVRRFSLGYLGNGELFKANRDSILVFINNRVVKSKLIEDAVIEAYHTKLMKGKYPTALIFIEIDPSDIDVNVHPAKKIVKFANQSKVFDLVKSEIEKFFIDDEDFISPYISSENLGLNKEFSNSNNYEYNNTNYTKIEKTSPKDNFLDINDFKNTLAKENKIYDGSSQIPVFDRRDYSNYYEKEEDTKIEENNINKLSEDSFHNKIVSSKFDENKSFNNDEFLNYSGREIENFKEREFLEEVSKNKYIFKDEDTDRGLIFDDISKIKNIDFRIIGQIFDSFILVERNELFEIYDQHIIHERILYEKLKQEYYNKKMTKQSLLVPIRIELEPKEKHIVLENLEIFSSFGFEIDDFEKNEILVRTVPVMNLRDSYENIIKEIVANIIINKNTDIRENIIVSMSCKGAIKANHKLKMEEMYSMVAKLHEVGEYTCPHGRPIIVKMSLADLEKMFKRK